MVANGVIHHTAFLVAPPSQVLAQIIYSDPNLTYFRGAIARADSGQTGLNKIDSLLKYPVVNMTVLAPNNAAFQALLDTSIRRALIAQEYRNQLRQHRLLFLHHLTRFSEIHYYIVPCQLQR